MALSDFSHPQQDRHVEWNLGSLLSLRPIVDTLRTPHQRALASDVLDTFAGAVAPQLATLGRQVIHGDVSPYNVIVASGQPTTVTGVIDFGDLARSPLVFDISVPLANLVDADLADPWSRATQYLHGFLTRRPIQDEELGLLAVTAPARLLQRVLITHSRDDGDPERRAYLHSHGADDWRNLEASWSAPRKNIAAALCSPPARHGVPRG